MLHLGGVQEAMTAAPPLRRVEKDASLVALLVFAVAVTTLGVEEFQFKNDPLMVVPEESVMVGAIVPDVPVGTVMELLLWLFTASEMEATRQVSKTTGRSPPPGPTGPVGLLVVPPILAKIGVVPGTLALNCT